MLSEDAHELHPRTDGKVTRAYVQFFRCRDPRAPFAKFPGAALIADAITAVRNGLADDDALNALTLTAGLAWREVAVCAPISSPRSRCAWRPRVWPCNALCCSIRRWRDS